MPSWLEIDQNIIKGQEIRCSNLRRHKTLALWSCGFTFDNSRLLVKWVVYWGLVDSQSVSETLAPMRAKKGQKFEGGYGERERERFNPCTIKK